MTNELPTVNDAPLLNVPETPKKPKRKLKLVKWGVLGLLAAIAVGGAYYTVRLERAVQWMQAQHLQSSEAKVDLTPILKKVEALQESLQKVSATGVDLEPVLDNQEQLKASLEAIKEFQGEVNPSPLPALANNWSEVKSELRALVTKVIRGEDVSPLVTSLKEKVKTHPWLTPVLSPFEFDYQLTNEAQLLNMLSEKLSPLALDEVSSQKKEEEKPVSWWGRMKGYLGRAIVIKKKAPAASPQKAHYKEIMTFAKVGEFQKALKALQALNNLPPEVQAVANDMEKRQRVRDHINVIKLLIQ